MRENKELEEEMASGAELLKQLGLTANYRGYHQVRCAMAICVQEEERLELVTKRVYVEVAERYGTNWKAVEGNIRRAGSIMWRENRALLEELSGYELKRRPRAGQLLAILVREVKRKGLQAGSSQPEKEEVKQGCGR